MFPFILNADWLTKGTVTPTTNSPLTRGDERGVSSPPNVGGAGGGRNNNAGGGRDNNELPPNKGGQRGVFSPPVIEGTGESTNNNEPPLKTFYNQISQNKTIKGLPETYEKFQSRLQSEDNRKALHNALLQNKTIKGLPKDFNKFNTLFTNELPPNKGGQRGVSSPPNVGGAGGGIKNNTPFHSMAASNVRPEDQTEPATFWKSIMESPKEFIKGVGRGTVGLAQSVLEIESALGVPLLSPLGNPRAASSTSDELEEVRQGETLKGDEQYTNFEFADVWNNPAKVPAWFSGTFGESLPQMLAALGVAVGSGGTGIPAMAGAYSVNAPLMIGQQLKDARRTRQQNNEEITSGDKLFAAGSGLAAAGVESIADAALLKNIFGKTFQSIQKSGIDEAAKENVKKEIGQSLSDIVIRNAKGVGKQMPVEAGTEMIQTVIENAGAKYGWKPEQELFEGVPEAGLAGALFPIPFGTVNTAVDVATRNQNNTTPGTPPPDADSTPPAGTNPSPPNAGGAGGGIENNAEGGIENSAGAVPSPPLEGDRGQSPQGEASQKTTPEQRTELSQQRSQINSRLETLRSERAKLPGKRRNMEITEADYTTRLQEIQDEIAGLSQQSANLLGEYASDIETPVLGDTYSVLREPADNTLTVINKSTGQPIGRSSDRYVPAVAEYLVQNPGANTVQRRARQRGEELNEMQFTAEVAQKSDDPGEILTAIDIQSEIAKANDDGALNNPIADVLWNEGYTISRRDLENFGDPVAIEGKRGAFYRLQMRGDNASYDLANLTQMVNDRLNTDYSTSDIVEHWFSHQDALRSPADPTLQALQHRFEEVTGEPWSPKLADEFTDQQVKAEENMSNAELSVIQRLINTPDNLLFDKDGNLVESEFVNKINELAETDPELANYLNQSADENQVLQEQQQVARQQANQLGLSAAQQPAAPQQNQTTPNRPAQPAQNTEVVPPNKGGERGVSTSQEATPSTPRVYRETNIDQAEAFLPTSNTSTGYQGTAQMFVSDNPDLALGQGDNQGVVLEFETDISDAQINTSKPFLEAADGNEYVLNKDPESMRDDLRKITVKSDAKAQSQSKASRFKTFANRLLDQGWTRETLDNGDIVYEHPSQQQNQTPISSPPNVEEAGGGINNNPGEGRSNNPASGTQNQSFRIQSREEYEQAKRDFNRQIGGQLSMGINPTLLKTATRLAVYQIEQGARKFSDFVKVMTDEFGDKIRPFLARIYNEARRNQSLQEQGITQEMSTPQEVQGFEQENRSGLNEAIEGDQRDQSDYIKRRLQDVRDNPRVTADLETTGEYTVQNIEAANRESDKLIKDFQEQFGESEGLLQVFELLKNNQLPDLMIGPVADKLALRMQALGMLKNAVQVVDWLQQRLRESARVMRSVRSDASPEATVSRAFAGLEREKQQAMDQTFKDGKTFQEVLDEIVATLKDMAPAADPQSAEGQRQQMVEAVSKLLTAEKESSRDKKNRKQAAEDIVDGYLNGQTVEQLADYFENIAEFQTLTDAQRKKIIEMSTQLSDLVNEGKTELAKAKWEEIMNYFEDIKIHSRPVNELILDLWYTGVLSGLTTIARSHKGSTLTATAHTITKLLANPRIAPLAITQMIKGFQGATGTYWNVIKTGRTDVQFADFKPQNPRYTSKLINSAFKDLNTRDKIMKVFYTAPVYAFRSILAWDQVLKHGLSEGFQTISEYDNALDENKSHRQTIKEVRKRLAIHKEQEAKKQAAAEIADMKDRGEDIPSGYEARRRREIVRENQDREVVKESLKESARAALVSTPIGTLGQFYQFIDLAITPQEGDPVPVLIGKYMGKGLFPFMRVAINYTNAGLDYTPYGFVRASKKTVWTSEGIKPVSRSDKRSYMLRASIGVATWSAALASLFEWDEDKGFKLKPEEDRWLDVVGSATGNWWEYSDIEPGFKPWSVRIRNPLTGEWSGYYSYIDNPIGFAIAPMGIMSDEVRFKELRAEARSRDIIEEKRAFKYLMGTGLLGVFRYSMDQSFNQGMNALGRLMDSEKTETFGKNVYSAFGRPIEGFYPGLYRQMYQQYQAVMEIPEKESNTWYENIARSVPFADAIIKNHKHDIFGYPVIREFNTPMVPDLLLKMAKDNLNYRETKPEWQLLHKFPEVTLGTFMPPATFDGEEVDNDTQNQYVEEAGLRLREDINRRYNYLDRLDKVELQKELFKLKARSAREARKAILENRGRKLIETQPPEQ